MKFEIRFFDTPAYDVEWDVPHCVIIEASDADAAVEKFKEIHPARHLWGIDEIVPGTVETQNNGRPVFGEESMTNNYCE